MSPEQVDPLRRLAELMYGRSEQRPSLGAGVSISDYAVGLEEEFLEELSRAVRPRRPPGSH